LSFPFFAKKLLARLPPFFNNLLLFMNNPSRLPPGIYFSWKPLEQVCFPLGRDLEMGINKAGSSTGKMQTTRFAAEFFFLIVISTGTLVWGNRVQ